MGNTHGRLFRVSTFGESHGPALGVIIDGCPPGLTIDPEDIQYELERRRPGQSAIVTQRKEADAVEILSGVDAGLSLGTPIAMLIRNRDQRSGDYQEMAALYRPSHADYTYDAKYGRRAMAGGGRASARETAARVAAGAIAKRWLRDTHGVEILAWVEAVADLKAEVDPGKVQRDAIEANVVRCPDVEMAKAIETRIKEIRKAGDSLGGVVGAVARGVPAGWGSPVFDKLDAELAKAMLSLPACKGFEIGSGFGGTLLKGSEHNDLFSHDAGGEIVTQSNRSGGVQGGISNGQNIVLRAAFKPTATVLMPQETVGPGGHEGTLKPKGRHDPCVLPRAVPIVEAMMALVLIDQALLQRAIMPAL